MSFWVRQCLFQFRDKRQGKDGMFGASRVFVREIEERLSSEIDIVRS